MYYKQEEIKEHAITTIKENLDYDKNYLDKDLYDIHHDLFNTDYYLVYYSACIEWLGNKTFECIEVIKDYEELNFCEVTTDLSNSEHVVNMYVYIVGEHILQDVINDIRRNQITNDLLNDNLTDETKDNFISLINN
tara:strand:+ start:614 stop:1021 length:408 start_codon:yes stop_codon:yes gene_type:complete